MRSEFGYKKKFKLNLFVFGYFINIVNMFSGCLCVVVLIWVLLEVSMNVVVVSNEGIKYFL